MSTPAPPRPRVKRLLDVEPLSERPARLKVRPFVEAFDRGHGLAALLMEGRLSGDRFEVSITGVPTISLAGSIGEDAHGPFVWLAPGDHPAGPRHALRIHADAHDRDGAHAALSYFELADDLAARREIDYASRWYSVYFNLLGLVDGSSWGGPRSVAPGRAAPGGGLS